MMQDYPKSLTGTKASVGFTVFDNWIGYSPVKNSPEDGKKKFDDGQPTTRRRAANRVLQLREQNLTVIWSRYP